MRFDLARRLEAWGVVAAMLAGGCASPPSVAPLLRAAGRAMEQERALLDADAERMRQGIDQQRAALWRGFEADVRARGELRAEWVLEGTAAYSAALELLTRHGMEQERTMQTRRSNLRDATRALERAIGLLEKQDALLEGVPDVRRWLDTKEEPR